MTGQMTETEQRRLYGMTMPASKSETVCQGHADWCAEHGHATWTVDGEAQGTCPRCGEVTEPAESAEQIEARQRDEDRAMRADAVKHFGRRPIDIYDNELYAMHEAITDGGLDVLSAANAAAQASAKPITAARLLALYRVWSALYESTVQA